MLLISVLAAVSIQTGGAPPSQDAELLLGKYKIADQEVQATLPSGLGPIPASAPRIAGPGGWSYLLDRYGQIVDRFKADGGWSELRLLFDEARAVQDKLPWRVKVVIFTRADLSEKTSDGVLRLRRFQVTQREAKSFYTDIARFASMAEAYSGGQLKLTLDVSLEDNWQSFGEGKLPFDTEFASAYFKPRINTGEFKADDGIYRGPYNSVFYIYPADRQGRSTWVNGSPVTGISLAFPARRAPNGSDGLTRSLFDAWGDQVVMHANERGYRWQDKDGGREVAMSMTPTMWKNIVGPKPSPDVYLERLSSGQPAAKDWEAVRDDPLARLGSVPTDQQPGFDKLPSEGAAAFSVDGHVVVRPWAADLFGTALDPGMQAVPVRTFTLGGQTLVVFKVAPNTPVHPLNLLKLQGMGVRVDRTDDRIRLSSSDGTIEGVATLGGTAIDFTNGSIPATAPNIVKISATIGGVRVERPVAVNWKPEGDYFPDSPAFEGKPPSASAGSLGMVARVATDPERGSVLQVFDEGQIRQGSVVLYEGAVFAPHAHRYLELWLKVKNPEPMQLTFHSPRGQSAHVGLFASLPGSKDKLVGIPNPDPAALPIWNKVVIDISQVPNVPEAVSTITLDVPKAGSHWERTQFTPTIWIDDVKVSRQAEGAVALADPPVKKADAASPDPEERALFAAKATADQIEILLTLLKDADHMVRANAVEAFRRIKEPRAVPLLADAARSYLSRIYPHAIAALAYQDTPESWSAIRQLVDHFADDVRAVAAETLVAKKDPTHAGPIAMLYSARSWRARAAAARAIGQLPGEEPQAILLAFANETDPAGRAAFVEAANPSIEQAANRLVWISVNDASDYVRALAALKLIRSQSERLRQEGYKALADDSAETRTEILDHLYGSPQEEARAAISQNLKDDRPSVRAAALRAYGSLSTVTVDQIKDVLLDKHPKVQRELISLVKIKGVKLPAEAIESLRSSVDPFVVLRAKEL